MTQEGYLIVTPELCSKRYSIIFRKRNDITVLGQRRSNFFIDLTSAEKRRSNANSRKGTFILKLR